MFSLHSCARQAAAIALILLILYVTAFANVDPKKGRVTTNPISGNSYTIEQEVDYGRKAIPEIEKDLSLLPVDHPTSKYIDKLGHNLADKAPGYKFPYTFRVVKQKEINAFALPGGPIYVNIGTIQAGSEAELAGVMGHEIAHVIMRHSTRQASRQAKASIPLAILSGVLGASVGGWAGSLAQMGISIGAGGVFTKYSRDAETEADMVGAQIIYDATGYNPNAMVTFFQKLKEQQGKGSGPSFLASHPDPGNRAKNVASILSRFPAKQFASADSPEFIAAKSALANVSSEAVSKAGEAVAEPEIRRLSSNEWATSNQFTDYDHGAFRVSYPKDWILKDERSTSLTAYPEGGASKETVAYGTILSAYTPRRGSNLDDATQQLMASMQDTNPSLRKAGNPVNISVNRRAAKGVEMLGQSAVREKGQPLAERIRLVTLQGKGGVTVYMVFVAPDPDFDGLRPVFDRIMRSFSLRE